MKHKVSRSGWDPDRKRTVTLGSRWSRDGGKSWSVEALWTYEQGPGREVLSVTIVSRGQRRHMSEACLRGHFREVEK